MNEMLDSQLSAMFDDELPPAECELLARRLSRDEALQARWRHYAVIGAAVRGERGLALNVDLSARIRSVIASEAPLSGALVADSPAAGRLGRRLWLGAAGAGLAAGVATLSVFWLRAQTPVAEEVLVAQAPASVISAPTGVDGGPDRYVVPVTVESGTVVPTAELANYVVAHSEYSAPLSRRNLLSALVASEMGTPQAGGSAGEQGATAPAQPEVDEADDAQ
jgi:sigma-E factor negative regulatory protein RseA